MLAAAWCGAGLFGASLAYFAYFYLDQLGRTVEVPAAAVPRAVALNVGLFTLFALHHSIFARTGARAWVRHQLPKGLERTTYVWLASLLFLGVCLLWQPLPGVAWQASGTMRLLLYGVQLVGVVLTLQSASRIDIWDLAGVRQARAATRHTAGRPPAAMPPADDGPPAQAAGLEERGPYRRVRHPIYLGWVVIVFAAPTMTASRLLFAAISTLYLVLAIPFEERSLTAEFGPAYTAYQQRVRWRLLPGVW